VRYVEALNLDVLDRLGGHLLVDGLVLLELTGERILARGRRGVLLALVLLALVLLALVLLALVLLADVLLRVLRLRLFLVLIGRRLVLLLLGDDGGEQGEGEPAGGQ